MSTPLYALDHRTVSAIAGPLLFVEDVRGVGLGEVLEVRGPDGTRRTGQVLALEGERAVVQVLQGSRGLDIEQTAVRFSSRSARLPVGPDLLGRVLDATGNPLDGGPPPLPVAYHDVHGRPLNPVARAHPSECVETGLSAIDGLNTLVRGQKLPIFSGFGLPADKLAARIAAQARVPGDQAGRFVVVFGAMGITRREMTVFQRHLARTGALERSVLFINRAEDPSLERLLLPRAVLTTAEYLAFEEGRHVLVLLTDMTHYCEALREVASAREEIPGRRGYPGYMYTDLATLYERAGRVQGREGSVTQLIILSMPDDDMTHPAPDLTGYITEGQIVLSRELHGRGIDPPIDVLPCLSRLMNAGIGAGKTREDHRPVANQLYALYARGRELRQLAAIIGEAALSPADKRALDFGETFERQYIHQGQERRSIEETLDLAWRLLAPFARVELKRLPDALCERYLPKSASRSIS